MTMTEPTTATERKEGRIVGIAGPVVDVECPRGALPELNSAVEFDIELEGETITVLAEVAQQLANDVHPGSGRGGQHALERGRGPEPGVVGKPGRAPAIDEPQRMDAKSRELLWAFVD